METKHTKGNWIYSKYSTDFGVYSEDGDGRDIAIVREYKSAEEAEANASLMAASPKLLESLNEMVALFDRLVVNGVIAPIVGKPARNKAKEIIYEATK